MLNGFLIAFIQLIYVYTNYIFVELSSSPAYLLSMD